MIKYHTWNLYWWIRCNGSSIFKWETLLPAMTCAIIIVALQHFGNGLTYKHPYVHRNFALMVSFVLTYRSQLAYQRFPLPSGRLWISLVVRFWEGRSMLQ